MPTLAQMMQAKNNQKDSSGESNSGNKTDVPDSGAKQTINHADASDQPVQSNQSDELASNEAPAQKSKPRVGGLKLGGLKLGNTGGSGLPESGGSDSPLRADDHQTDAPGGSDLSGESGDTNSGDSTPASGSTGLSLTDIAGLSGSDSFTSEGLITIDAVDPEGGEGYLDEVPATAPERELPEEMTEQMQGFISSLDAIYKLHDDPEMFANVVRKIMSEMQDNPNLVDLLADEDSNALIRGLRQHAGLAQVKKQESKAKYARGKASQKPQSAAVDSVMSSLQQLAGFDGSFD